MHSITFSSVDQLEINSLEEHIQTWQEINKAYKKQERDRIHIYTFIIDIAVKKVLEGLWNQVELYSIVFLGCFHI